MRRLGLAALAGLGACTDPGAREPTRALDYVGIETLLLAEDLVRFQVSVAGARGPEDVEAYARCAAAQYALIRGFGFARHVRTHVHAEASLWRGDAVYTISESLPAGHRTIDAEVTVADCKERRIPTV